jgi:predicted restriction endonuclease
VHHIEFFSRGGLTVIGNLIGLCLFHHKQIHLENMLIVGDPNRQITIITKRGNTYTSTPSVSA